VKSLLIVPLKPNASQSMKTLCMEKLDEVRRMYGDSLQIVVDERGSGDAHITTHDDRQSHIARIRQSILNDVLQAEHKDVFWMDADIVYFDVRIFQKMMKFENAIVAPMVLLNNSKDHLGITFFYDLAGFIENGRWANRTAPYLSRNYTVIEMDSVGAFYKVPARVYHSGAFYYPVAGYTEHYSVCEFARRKLGMKVLCDARMEVYHHDLAPM
jgi:hypothetical protein